MNSHQPIENILSCVGLTSVKGTAQKITVLRVCIHTHTMTPHDGIHVHGHRNHTMKSHPGMELKRKERGIEDGKGYEKRESGGSGGSGGKGKIEGEGVDGKRNTRKGRGKQGEKNSMNTYLTLHNVYEKAYYLYVLQA